MSQPIATILTLRPLRYMWIRAVTTITRQLPYMFSHPRCTSRLRSDSASILDTGAAEESTAVIIGEVASDFVMDMDGVVVTAGDGAAWLAGRKGGKTSQSRFDDSPSLGNSSFMPLLPRMLINVLCGRSIGRVGISV